MMRRFVFDFVDNTALHGAPFFRRGKYLLLLCATACASFGLWECRKTFKTFLLFNVKTKVETKDTDKTGTPFPAITFSSAMQLQRPVVAGTQQLIVMTYTATAGMSLDRAMKWQETCYNSTVKPLFIDFLHLLDNYTYVQINSKMNIDSNYSVRQCLQNMKPFNCGRQFLNRPIDVGFGMTFNPDPAVTEAYPLEEHFSGSDKNYARAYGTTGPERMTFTSYQSGRRAGVQFIMKILESDYCAPTLGAQTGMMAVVHDPSAEPIALAKSYVMLGPGFVHNVALHMKKTVRKTESYGYCNSHLYLKYYNETVDYVSKDKYIVNCLTDAIVKQCKCIPYYAPPKTGMILQGGGAYKEGQMFACSTPGSAYCQMEREKVELSWNGTCFREMPLPCTETKFTAQVTSTTLAPSNTWKSLKRMMPIDGDPIANLHMFRQSFVIANFYMGSSTYQLATEKIAMTWVDLMNSVGGAVGMAVGMSLITIMELISFFFYSTYLRMHYLLTWMPPQFTSHHYFE